jgi:hypothetical protein
MAERTWKYASVARTKKNTIVSMGEDAAWVEIGRIKALMVSRLWMYASGPVWGRYYELFGWVNTIQRSTRRAPTDK